MLHRSVLSNSLKVIKAGKYGASPKRSWSVISNGEDYEKLQEFIPPSTKIPPKQDRISYFASLVDTNLPKNPQLKDILKGVWANEVITSQCPDLVIRLTSLRGQVSKRLWEMKGNNPEDVQILAVGTVDIPNHLKKYHKFLDHFYQYTSEKTIAEKFKKYDYEVGYDLLSKGADESRAAVLKLFNEHYGFDQSSIEKFSMNSAITSGGMRGLKDIADGMILYAKEKGRAHRFISPDNSFGTWWNIIERPEKGDKNRREIFVIEAKPENKLQLTADDVVKFYQQNAPTPNESWYITPVGNPSGTKMTSNQLVTTVEAIVKKNPDAVIVLDSVYVRTCSKADGKDLMKELARSPELLKHIVFLESFSKSHGLCRERLAMYFSTNEHLFTRIHTANIAFSAGPGVHKDYQFLALGNASASINEGVEELHHHWMKERKGLLKYLLQPKFSHLFEQNQIHIRSEDIDHPCTLYILLKVNKGVKAQDVFIETGALGVDTPLLSGHYIRFSVGGVKKPTYATYI